MGLNPATHIVLFTFVFIDVLGFSIILPLLPFLAERFDVGPTEIGWLVASNAIAQVVAAPIIGKLSDRFGRRLALLTCVGASCLGFLALSRAETFTTVILCRVFDGLFGGNISLAQTYMTDVTSENTRTRGMGILGAALGLGFIFGPAVGAFLSPNYYLAAYIAAVLSFLNFTAVFMMLPESLPRDKRDTSSSLFAIFPLGSIFRGLLDYRLRPVLLARFILGVLLTTVESYIGLFLEHELGAAPRMAGLVLTLFATLYSLTQSPFILTRVAARLSEKSVMVLSFLILGVSLWLWSVATSMAFIMGAIALFAFGAGFLNPLISSLISRLAGGQDKGGFLGLSASIGSLTRIVAPVLGGYAIDAKTTVDPDSPLYLFTGYRGPALAASIVAIVTAVYLQFAARPMYGSSHSK